MWRRRIRKIPHSVVAVGGGLVLFGALIAVGMWWSDGGSSVDNAGGPEASFQPYEGDGEEDDGARGASDDERSRPGVAGEAAEDSAPETGDRRFAEEASDSSGDEGLQAGEDRDTVEGDGDFERPEGVGPTRWMADPEDLDVEGLEQKVRDGEARQARELAVRQDHRRSVSAVEGPLRECYEALNSRVDDAGHRVALRWNYSTTGATGVVESPEIVHHIGAGDDAFADCIASELDGLPFEALTDGEEATVEYAFFLE